MLKTLRLGKTGLTVTKTAMGCLPVQRCDEDYAVRLLRAAYDGGTERRMVNIRIGREQDYVNVVPSSEFEFFLGRGEKICQLWHRLSRRGREVCHAGA